MVDTLFGTMDRAYVTKRINPQQIRFRPFKYLTNRNTVWDNNLIAALFVLVGGMTAISLELHEMCDMREPESIIWRCRKEEEKTKDELDESMKHQREMAKSRMEDIKRQNLLLQTY